MKQAFLIHGLVLATISGSILWPTPARAEAGASAPHPTRFWCENTEGRAGTSRVHDGTQVIFSFDEEKLHNAQTVADRLNQAEAHHHLRPDRLRARQEEGDRYSLEIDDQVIFRFGAPWISRNGTTGPKLIESYRAALLRDLLPNAKPAASSAPIAVTHRKPAIASASIAVAPPKPATSSAVIALPQPKPATSSAVIALPQPEPTTSSAVIALPLAKPATSSAVISPPQAKPATSSAVIVLPHPKHAILGSALHLPVVSRPRPATASAAVKPRIASVAHVVKAPNRVAPAPAKRTTREVATWESRAGGNVAQVLWHDHPLFTFDEERGPFASRIAERLNELYRASLLRADRIQPGRHGKRYMVNVGSELLFDFDRGFASRQGYPPERLALRYVDELRKALGAASYQDQIARSVSRGGFEHDALIGLASWYGGFFHGRRAADGSRFDQNDLTAAHKTLPLGTLVLVTNLHTRQSAVVRVTDRGPYVRGRMLDLSRGAAKAIGMVHAGVSQVKVLILAKPAHSDRSARR